MSRSVSHIVEDSQSVRQRRCAGCWNKIGATTQVWEFDDDVRGDYYITHPNERCERAAQEDRKDLGIVDPRDALLRTLLHLAVKDHGRSAVRDKVAMTAYMMSFEDDEVPSGTPLGSARAERAKQQSRAVRTFYDELLAFDKQTRATGQVQ